MRRGRPGNEVDDAAGRSCAAVVRATRSDDALPDPTATRSPRWSPGQPGRMTFGDRRADRAARASGQAATGDGGRHERPWRSHSAGRGTERTGAGEGRDARDRRQHPEQGGWLSARRERSRTPAITGARGASTSTRTGDADCTRPIRSAGDRDAVGLDPGVPGRAEQQSETERPRRRPPAGSRRPPAPPAARRDQAIATVRVPVATRSMTHGASTAPTMPGQAGDPSTSPIWNDPKPPRSGAAPRRRTAR